MEGKATARLLGGQARNFDLPDPSYRRRYSRRGFAPRNPSDARGDETTPPTSRKRRKNPFPMESGATGTKGNPSRAPSLYPPRGTEIGQPPPQDGGAIFLSKNEMCQKVLKISDFGDFSNRKKLGLKNSHFGHFSELFRRPAHWRCGPSFALIH